MPDNSNCLALWSNIGHAREGRRRRARPTGTTLRAAVETLTAGTTSGIAMSAVKSEEGTFQWLPFLWAAGADLDSLDSDGGRAALALWVDFVKAGQMSRSIVNWDQAAVLQQFENDRAALMVNGPWQIPTIRPRSRSSTGRSRPLPQGQTSASILGGENIADHEGIQERRRGLGVHPLDPGAGEPARPTSSPRARSPRARTSPSRGNGPRPGGEGVRRAARGRPAARLRAEVPGDLGRGPGHAPVRADGRRARSTRRSRPRPARSSRCCRPEPMTVGSPSSRRRSALGAPGPRPHVRGARARRTCTSSRAAVPAGARALSDRLQHPQQPDRPQRRHVPGRRRRPSSGSTTTRRCSRDEAFRHAVGVSLVFTVACIVLQFTIGLALALFFARPFPGAACCARCWCSAGCCRAWSRATCSAGCSTAIRASCRG